jgi:hypothetical protein
VVDFVGELFYYIPELLYMLWPAKKDRWVIPIAIGSMVLIIAFVALAVFLAVGRASWIQTLGGPTVIDGDSLVVAGLLTAMALCAGAALVLSFLHWKEWKAQKQGQGDGPVWKKAKPLGGLLLRVLNTLRNRFRRRLTPGEIQRREQRSRTRL